MVASSSTINSPVTSRVTDGEFVFGGEHRASHSHGGLPQDPARHGSPQETVAGRTSAEGTAYWEAACGAGPAVAPCIAGTRTR